MQHYVARLYRCVLFDVGALRVHGEGGLWGPCSAGALHSASELLARDKRVGVLSGSPLRAKVIKAATCEGGLPAEVAAWTSGELICRSLEGSLDHEVISALPKPPKVFELGIFAKPQRWSDTARRGAPPLEGLARAGHLKRVESIEDANLCYWDAQEGDKLDHWLEAAVELCADLKVRGPPAAAQVGRSRLGCCRAADRPHLWLRRGGVGEHAEARRTGDLRGEAGPVL